MRNISISPPRNIDQSNAISQANMISSFIASLIVEDVDNSLDDCWEITVWHYPKQSVTNEIINKFFEWFKDNDIELYESVTKWNNGNPFSKFWIKNEADAMLFKLTWR